MIGIYDFERVFISTSIYTIKKDEIMEQEALTRDWLIKEMAYRARFTQSDIRIIWSTFEDIIKDIIHDKNELMISGLFKMHIKTIKAHDGWNASKNEKMLVPEINRICFKPSKVLTNLLKEKK
jgi:nucleoid DNA-binding protein